MSDDSKRCDLCGKLKESPGAFAIVERGEQQTVRLCWDCHDRGRSL